MRNRILTSFESIGKIAEEIAKIKGVKAVYLFGSHATRKQGPLSDIDICIIGNLNENERERALSPLSDNLDITFFDELPIYIKFRVFKEGRPLVIKDEEFLNFMKIKTLQEYLDFKPLINKYIKEVLNVQLR